MKRRKFIQAVGMTLAFGCLGLRAPKKTRVIEDVRMSAEEYLDQYAQCHIDGTQRLLIQRCLIEGSVKSPEAIQLPEGAEALTCHCVFVTEPSEEIRESWPSRSRYLEQNYHRTSFRNHEWARNL